MRIGVHFNYQNYTDWERFEARQPGPPAVSDQQLYEEELALGGLVEPLGFDSYWAIDHHFSPYTMTSGAVQHLTYFAGKTQRIDFGTMVIVLPWYDPVVVAEQVSVLDNLFSAEGLSYETAPGYCSIPSNLLPLLLEPMRRLQQLAGDGRGDALQSLLPRLSTLVSWPRRLVCFM